jgi:hypothetical protein
MHGFIVQATAAAQRLTVNGDVLGLTLLEREAAESSAQGVGVKGLKEIMIRCMAGRFAGLDAKQAKRLGLQPPAPTEDPKQIVGASQHRCKRNSEHRPKRVLPPLPPPEILDLIQSIPKRAHPLKPPASAVGLPIESDLRALSAPEGCGSLNHPVAPSFNLARSLANQIRKRCRLPDGSTP